jgi:hypothetical protein
LQRFRSRGRARATACALSSFGFSDDQGRRYQEQSQSRGSPKETKGPPSTGFSVNERSVLGGLRSIPAALWSSSPGGCPPWLGRPSGS